MNRFKQLPIVPALLVALAVWVGVSSIASITTSAPSLSALNQLPVILIDPGHGGFDGGAVGIGKVVEKDINLAISQKLYELFTANGFEVVLMRNEDISLEDAGLSTIRKRKGSDIRNRLKTAQSYDNCILLSIHQNKFPQASPFGAQVFYGPKNPESAQMAEILQARMIGMLQPDNTRRTKPCPDSVYLIYNAPMPALLVECGFLSNAQDVQKLTDPTYQRKVAFAIFAATCESLGLQASADAVAERTVI